MRRDPGKRAAPVMIGCASAFFASAALGADKAADKDADEIVVTATKRETLANETPASIDIISDDIAAITSDFDSAEDVTRLLAGVEAAVANGVQVAYQIRGIGAVDHQALTPTAAAVYMDGVFLATNVQTGPLVYDIARVEVLKGPQGTLYGRNASSGAINFISASPSSDAGGYLDISLGQFGRVDVKSAVSGPLSDAWNMRLAGRFLRQDAALENVSTSPGVAAGPKRAGGERDEFGLRASLQRESDNVSVLFRAHYEEDNGVNPSPRNSTLALGDHQISVGADGVQETDNEFFGASAEIKASLGDWRIYSLTALEGYNQQYGFDFDGAASPFGDPTLNANLAYDRDFLQWSEEFRLLRDWDGFSTLIGAAAAGDDFEQRYLIWCGTLDPATLLGTCRYVGAPGRVGPNPASPGVATSLVTDIEQQRFTAAIFNQNDIRLSDRVWLTLGARYTYEDIDGEGSGRHIFDDGVIDFNDRGGLGPAVGANSITENRLSGMAAMRMQFNDAAMIYASYSNGYKSGGFNGEVQNNATHFQDEGLFAAETVNAIEAGFKGEPIADLSLRAALFYQFYDAPQARIFVNFPLPDGTSITSNSLSNLDKARAYGFEATLDWLPTPCLHLNSSLVLLDTKISQTTDVGGNAALFDDNRLPFAPKTAASAFARYAYPLGDGLTLALQVNAKYQSAIYLDAEGLASRRQGGYALVDGEISLAFDESAFEISAWVRNLLNEDYAVSGFGFIGYNVFLGPPRSWGVSMRKAF